MTPSAIELFRKGEISLCRGAEIAGVDFESFRSLLSSLSIPWEIDCQSRTEMNEAIQQFFRGAAE